MPHASPRPSSRRRLLGLLGLALALCGTPADAGDALADALAAGRLQAWQQLLEQGGDDERALLERVNRFVNRSVQHGEDQDIWGQADYWATPQETLGRGRGDCEDIAIAKYFGLVRLGVPSERLRLTFVKSLEQQRAHMVLAYYGDERAEPLILDNLRAQILPAGQRGDLLPVYAFNNHGIFFGSAPQRRSKQTPQLLSRWQDVNARTLAEAGAPADLAI
ncbi:MULTISPECIES: transglutaminase-like cysteine peptidase [unclassified Pseudomonas]|uniref:transglutaminase-like cysteine peptidase n=1 Tax=unclassified Pseudomonas TaxID=196821 RepID=UPI00244AD584|nr:MULTISPECIES: transglutaminase-like cysteine peptidase [unclassified Pseudomonas]MDG9928907.1 transglutaminase-like cysteine peptidase [Pseudomonas sp. GD04042]MDH0484277.1 transglutaminase-like cysteine peptidase [Pseudomonas sp. GD04015]MDH0604233.1 transglutaminase-like cysteine peptidase [Pseudomonas sp. GD03869]